MADPRGRLVRLLRRGRPIHRIPLTLIYQCLALGYDVSAIERRIARLKRNKLNDKANDSARNMPLPPPQQARHEVQ